MVLGDCRGNITLAALESHPSASLDNAAAVRTVTTVVCMARAHGTEVVSCLSVVGGSSASKSSFCSLGHDGFLNIYEVVGDASSGTGAVSLSLTSRFSSLPINTPDQVVAIGEGSEQLSLYVGGYEASEYVVWDVHRKYQLLRADAGGWRRPHCLAVHHQDPVDLSAGGLDYLPLLTFAYLAPLDRGTVLKCMGTSPPSSAPISLPLHLGVPGHGKVSYCGAVIPCTKSPPLLAVGSEDGTLKLFQLTGSQCSRSPTQSQLASFVQEVHMPSHSSVRAVAHSSRRPGRGVIVCAGWYPLHSF